MSETERTPSLPPPQAVKTNDQEQDAGQVAEFTESPLQNQRKRSRSPQDRDRPAHRGSSNNSRDRSPGDPDSRNSRRSHSPHDVRAYKKPRRKDAGFKWKEKRRDDAEGPNRNRDEGLKRGYRDQYKPRRRSRSRSKSQERDRGGGRGKDRDRADRRDKERRRSRSRSPRGHDSHKSDRRDRDRDHNRTRDRPKRDDPPSRPPAPAPAQLVPQQEMILVTVNDRLGTKKQIPCLVSDTIKDFKAVVAMMIGRRPHEILLKRQSERPFKDFLTLQDYGVSNGASLDLEVDTGD